MNRKATFLTTLAAALLLLASGSAQGSRDPALGIAPVQDSDFYRDGQFPTAQVELGRLLFFDKILSGNKNIACSSCHHPEHGSSDGLALGLGEGATGLGQDRQPSLDHPVLGRVPRNAQALYLLGARSFERLFHDGRVERDPYRNWDSGFWSPAREQLPAGLDNVLAAQAMFPVLSPIEMAGHKGENEIADAVAVDQLAGSDGAWARLAQRLQAIPEYVTLFQKAFANIETAADIRFVEAANAIAAFEATAFRADGSAFDQYLRTRDAEVLGATAWRGMTLFYGKAQCSRCHSGPFQTDQQFHAIAMPQIGPGKNDGWDQSYWQATGFMARLEDQGRYRVTQRAEDRYRFRTPSLRNVELTGPWGHAGSYASLEAVVRHHLDPLTALESYRSEATTLPRLDQVLERTARGSQLQFRPVNPRRLQDYLKRDDWVMASADLRHSLAAANELDPMTLAETEISDLVAFLHALTDPRSRDQSDLIPERVPSGLSLDD